MKYYGIKVLKKEIIVSVHGEEVTIPIDWADGMCGSIPVFDSRTKAIEYAKDEASVFELDGNK